MREDLKRRLQQITKKLALVHRLRKVALATEDALIDRMAERSKKVLLDVRGKFFSTAKRIEPTLDEAGREAFAETVEELSRVLTDSGDVNSSAADEVKANLTQIWKRVGRATKGSLAITHFFNSLDRFITVVRLGSLLQNPRLVQRAKTESGIRDKFYSIMEQMAQVIPRLQANLQRATGALPKPEAPPSPTEDIQDPTPEKVIAKQLTEAEGEMRGVVTQLSTVIVKKAEELFGLGSDIAEALDENIFAIFNKRQVNPRLNRDSEFYKDALHLEHSPTHIDLGDFLDTKEKKAIYLCYRSFVMTARALGVVQHAKAKPEQVMSNPKLQELVVKAQKILMSRKDTIVRYLQVLKKPEKEEKDKEVGIPKGTFSDFFENQSA